MNKWEKLLFLTCMATAFANDAWGQCASIYRKAETLMESGKYREAIKNFNAAMQCDNNLTESCKIKIGECEKRLKKASGPVSSAVSTASYGLTVDRSQLTFGFETTSSKVVKIQSFPEKWIATSNTEWCRAVASEKTLSVSCEINDQTEERTATVTVSNGKTEAEIKVVQEGKKIEEYIAVRTDRLVFDKKGEIKELAVDTNAEWEVTDIAPWCEVVVHEQNRLILRAKAEKKKNWSGMKKHEKGEGVLVLKTKGGKIASLIIAKE